MTPATIDSPPETAPVTRRHVREQRSSRRSRLPAPAYAPSREETAKHRSRIARRLFSAATLLFCGALVVAVSVPANAFYSADVIAGFQAPVNGQSLTADGGAVAAGIDTQDFSVTSAAERIAKQYGAQGGRYTPTTGSVRWPFPYATTITDGFGPRKSPCAGCSTFHKGTDFTPGINVPTYAIAAGVVESSVVSNSGLGNEVIIDHVIDGVPVQSLYGHLAMSSSPLRAGDTVEVGDLVGLVGATGTVTGANMHLEIHVKGVAVNPFTWLQKNAR